MHKTAILVANDKLGRRLICALQQSTYYHDIDIIIDKSSTLKRIWKLLIKKSISLTFLLKTFMAECLRQNTKLGSETFPAIHNQQDLLNLIESKHYQTIYMFRAGLIINRQLLAQQTLFLNIHCAKVPEYGGLGSIYRALCDEQFQQTATLHHVTEQIDRGEVLQTKDYVMQQHHTYYKNEELAYNTGIALLLERLALQNDKALSA